MSVVATRVYKDRIEIASDSQITWGMTMQNAKNVKLFATDLGVTVGACGSMQEISLFKIFLRTRIPSAASEDAILEFIHEFRGWMADTAPPADEDENDTSYHLIFGGRAFCIAGYAIREITDYDAIGAGMDYALTALYLGKTAQEAVEVASALNIFCSAPTAALSIPCDV